MAERYERYTRDKRETNLAKRLGNTTTIVEPKERQPYDPSKQAEGIKTRLEASGLPVEEVMDKRKPVEKALNLTEDQNFFFDVLEVLNRPQQAIFTGVKALQEGKSFGEGFKKGLTGEDYTRFAQILNEAGMGSENKFGLDDVLGFIGDVFLDPADLAIMGAGLVLAPATGGASTSLTVGTLAANAKDVGKASNIITDAAKALGKTAKNSFDNLLKKSKTSRELSARLMKDVGSDIASGKVLTGAKKLITSKPIKLSNGQTIRKFSATDLTMGSFKNVLKSGGKASDWFVRHGIAPVYAKGLGKELDSVVGQWDNALKAIESAFSQASKMGGKLANDAQLWLSKKSGGRIFIGAYAKDMSNQIDKIVDNMYDLSIKNGDFIGIEVADAKKALRERVNRELFEFAEVDLEVKTTATQVLFGDFNKDLPIDEKVADYMRSVINRPEFKSLKMKGVRSKHTEKVFNKQFSRLKLETAKVYETQSTILKAERQAIIDSATTTTKAAPAAPKGPLDAKGFIDDVTAGTPSQTVIDKLSTPKKPTKPSRWDAKGFVDDVAAGKPSEDIIREVKGADGVKKTVSLTPEQQQRLDEIDRLVKEYSAKSNDAIRLAPSDESAKQLRKELKELADGNMFGDETSQALLKLLKEDEDIMLKESMNLFDDLFEERKFIEDQATGKTMYVYVMKKGDETDAVLRGLQKRLDDYAKVLSKEDLDILKSVKRFTGNSSLKYRLEKLIKETGFSKKFEDIFYYSDKTGMWHAKDKQALEELLTFASPENLMEKVVDGSRFRTDEELVELRNKYAPGFQNEQAYREIIDKMEETMQWFDAKYHTTMFKKTPGYMHHAATNEAKEFMRLQSGYKGFLESVGIKEDDFVLAGNTKVFRARKYDMPAVEANRVAKFNAERVIEANQVKKFLTDDELMLLQDRATQDLFSEYFMDSFTDTLTKMNDYGSAINVMNTAVISTTFEGKDVLRFTDDAKEQVTGFVNIDKSLLKSKVEKMAISFQDNKSMKLFIKKFVDADGTGSRVLVDKNVFDMIGRLGETKTLNDFFKIIEKTNNMFKKLKIFSAGFHFKNLMGNASNLYLAGVAPTEIAPMLYRGIKGGKRSKKLLEIFAEGGEEAIKKLGRKDQDMWRAYKLFTDAGFEDAGKYLYDMDSFLDIQGKQIKNANERFLDAKGQIASGQIGKGVMTGLDSALMKNVEFNQIVDSGYRLGYIQKLMKENLTDEEILMKVKLALLDPSNMTVMEKELFKKFIPFYTFTKKNLAFQFKNFFDNPVRYKRFADSVRGTWEMGGLDWDEDIQTYQKENLWLPIPLTMKDGKYLQLRTSFPVSDLGEFISNPIQKILASMTPMVRAPFEYVTNKEIYSGMEIERFEGQKGRNFGELGISAKQEYLIGQTGMDRPMIAVKSAIDVLRNKDKGTIAPTVYSVGDVGVAQRSKAYDELDTLRDLLSYYKQEQIPIMTLAEIENINKPRASLADRLRNIQKRSGR